LKYIIVLDIKEKLFYYIHIVEIPTNKQTLTNLNFRKEGIMKEEYVNNNH